MRPRWSGASEPTASSLTPGQPGPYDRWVAAYSELVKDHFSNPRNAGTMENPDGEGFVHNPVCGDRMRLWIHVKDDTIQEVRWQTKGCPAAIATSSVTSEMVRGWSLERVTAITREEISAAIGGLPKDKVHCSVLAGDALRLAVADYRGRGK